VNKLDDIVAQSRQEAETRGHSYREQALKMYPWVCGKCGREFTRKNLNELTVHHKDHDHDNNLPDGSNWELLCLYCHDNEHSRNIYEADGSTGTEVSSKPTTSKPFANLKELLNKK